MLEKILKVLKSEGVIYNYDIIEDNNINIIVGDWGDVTKYKFKQEDNTFTLEITERKPEED